MKHETKERNKKLRARYYELKQDRFKTTNIIEQLSNEFFLSSSQIIAILYSKRYKEIEKS